MTDFETKTMLAISVGLVVSSATFFLVGRATAPKPLDFGCLSVRPVDDGRGVTVACPGESDTILKTEDTVLVRCDCQVEEG